MSAFFDAYGAHKAMKARQATWGHLAAKPRKKYKGWILFSVSEFSGQGCSIIRMDFAGLDSSPWLYEAMNDFVFNRAYACEQYADQAPLEEGGVYLWTGAYQLFAGRRDPGGRARYLDESHYRFDGAVAPVPIPCP